MQVLAGGLNPKNWNIEQFTANGAVWVKKGKITKKIKVENLPLKDIVDFLN
jgi:predicted Zn-dependent protease